MCSSTRPSARRRLAPEWELIREPEPIRACGTLIFPDFAVRHRHDKRRRAWIEIVGFRSPECLRRKLEPIRDAKLENLILCIDDSLACDEQDAPIDARIVRFSRHLDPELVLRTRVELQVQR